MGTNQPTGRVLTGDLQAKARLLQLAGDETRLRILCVLFRRRSPCVSDIAAELDMSIASISHHLRLLEDNGVLTSQRDGKHICYSFKATPLLKQIEKFICY